MLNTQLMREYLNKLDEANDAADACNSRNKEGFNEEIIRCIDFITDILEALVANEEETQKEQEPTTWRKVTNVDPE